MGSSLNSGGKGTKGNGIAAWNSVVTTFFYEKGKQRIKRTFTGPVMQLPGYCKKIKNAPNIL